MKQQIGMKVSAAFLAVCAQAATADEATLAKILQQDGPYIDIPNGLVVPSGPPSLDDLITLADLDGDPSIISEQETEMLTVLMQVLIHTPLTQ